MLLPLSSASWPRSSPDGVIDLRFEYAEYALDTPGHGSATVLASSRAKPDSLNPTKIISESTLSLLSRPYSSSSTESSCECSETSSVDENFQCGSGSPRIGPTMELNAAHWVLSESPSPDNVTATTDGDEPEFSLIPATSDVKMIIPLTTTGVEQPPWPLSPQPREHMAFDNQTEGSLPACTVEEESDNREEAAVVAQPASEVCTSQNEFNAERINLIAPTSEDCAVETSSPDGTRSPQSECMEPSTASVTEAPIKRRRSSLSAFGGHACSTCHLYAPSTSPTFYLDAWLKQQNYERSPEQASLPRKKVSWPSTTAELRKVVVVNRWIERGVHVHPQPTSRNQYDDDMDSDDDEEFECKQIETVDSNQSQAKVTIRPEEKRQPSASNENGRDSDNDSVTSVTSGQEETLTTSTAPVQSSQQQITKSSELSLKPSTASSTSSSTSSTSSNASSTSTSPSSVSPSTDMPAAKSPNAVQQQKNTQTPRAQTPSPALTPKKKYNSGIKVTVIGGPYSEHEAAVRIRGADPIKHRAMIENYWQF